MDAVKEFRDRATNPDHPTTKGTLQNSDIYFQQQEVQNKYYEALPDIVEDYMEKISALTGREYHPFRYYGAPDADRMIIAMGSLTDAIEETVDFLNKRGEKVGLLAVHLYRPFSENTSSNIFRKRLRRSLFLTARKNRAPLLNRCTSTLRAYMPARKNSLLS